MGMIKNILIWTFAIIIAIIAWPFVLMLLALGLDIIIIAIIAIWIVALIKS
jgi:hypothetical protein